MKYEYPYVKFRNQCFPLIPLRIEFQRKHLNTLALVDSGASISLFKPEIAIQLGIEVEKGKEILLEGISGKISIYLHRVSFQVGEKRFVATVGFSEEYVASFNLIGRKDFFANFLITFDEGRRKVKLEIKR